MIVLLVGLAVAIATVLMVALPLQVEAAAQADARRNDEAPFTPPALRPITRPRA